MSKQFKPLRSALYMPCSNTRALEKATQLQADAMIFDLEDAVSPDKKSEARQNICQALKEKDYGLRQKAVRVNHVDSEWGQDDLKSLKGQNKDAVVLPKVESIEEINQALALLDEDIPVWAMIETPLGVINVEKIAAHKNIAALVMGTNDLAKEMRVSQSEQRTEFLYTFQKCIMAAKAYDCDILDGVFNKLDDEQALEIICQQAKMLGFDGKTLIHPKQLHVANAVFSPSIDEVEQARQIVQQWQQVENDGVLVIDGKMVEELHVKEAERILEIDNVIQQLAG